MIIDSHVHRYPEEVINDPEGWGRSLKEDHWVNLVTDRGSRRSIQGWASRERLLADMKSACVKQVVLMGWYWEQEETCRLQNEWHLRWVEEDPERMIGFAAVQPRAGDRAFDDVRRAIDSGLKGIGEIFPAVQGFTMRNQVWIRILEWAQEIGIPVNLHVTEPAGHHYEGKVYGPLSEYECLAKEFSNLKFIFSHWGGGLPFYELNKECRKSLRNVFYDTSASPLLYDHKIFRVVADIVGADRILFGSDYPIRLYPKEEQQPGFLRFAEEVAESGLTEEELFQVFRGNLERLLGDSMSMQTTENTDSGDTAEDKEEL
ncbi:MAG: hypothetical protein DF168_01069 [Candidatus Moanabacter tarae]|uniref:Amidohydrolase-related domain-containing protein n=1 Tax=Candidatus Moanibacter tarae TaxID=2200854 RepID=A0A2Z4AQ06_9BACT|nr:MAG: hypothetical protein DF168_01069 [Candidatus Moanabacter tarae]|tara:strand:+ start:3323 stop:4273 length:951 start_codon:yes stop_codon:yes gene_type:complete